LSKNAQLNLPEAISKLGFSVEITCPASPSGEDGRHTKKTTRPGFNRIFDGHTQVVEDLGRGLNADIGRKDFFEMTSRYTTA
jgi:hypothetical protein